MIVSVLQALPEGTLAGTLVVVIGLLLATDKLVTGPQRDRELAAKDKVIDTLTETLDVKDQQLEKSLDALADAVPKETSG